MEQEQYNSVTTRICKVVALIPTGYVASYGQVADLAGLPGRARSVSRALNQAPKALNLPWHRVVNSQNKLSFAKYSELYQAQKQLLLAEGVCFKGLTIAAEHRWQPPLSTLLQLEF
ncbi:MGMT family protein [Motilimonas pumila]|uniref:Methylated-DNA--[protein]-cysteine S-methyltransferase n=1 Tax=Motilimonas pumila TaxID=2303987 RepID=A0A418YJW0_9GAMM|nr:methylated-DNA--[protein]-cysteine S-methyltransferase [Motilimonas pumila]RJG51268.1 methylated-DNA--[protein]-cysteine S-methyltransferase [Motilimonas pumila]